MPKARGSRLTPKRVEGLKPGPSVYRVTDAGAPLPGLMLEVRPSGGRSWVSRLTIRQQDETGKARRGRRVDAVLGRWPVMSVEEARRRHVEATRYALTGHDPRVMLARPEGVRTFGALMAAWLEHLAKHGGLSPRTVAAHRSRWLKHLSHLDGLPLDEVGRADIAPELARLADKHPTAARACLVTLRQAWQWGSQRGWTRNDPVTGMKPEAIGGVASRPRDVFLTLEELREVWLALPAGRLSGAVVAALRLLILTGARRAEVAGMQLEEVDLSSGQWLIPASRTKTRVSRTVYLSSLAVELIEEQAASRCAGAVFRVPGSDGAITPDTLTTTVRRLREGRLSELAASKPFTVHDLRRSAATAWGEHLSARPDLIERMLGHARRDALEATYQHQQMAEQQRRAFDAWGELVSGAVNNPASANVTTIRQKA